MIFLFAATRTVGVGLAGAATAGVIRRDCDHSLLTISPAAAAGRNAASRVIVHLTAVLKPKRHDGSFSSGSLAPVARGSLDVGRHEERNLRIRNWAWFSGSTFSFRRG